MRTALVVLALVISGFTVHSQAAPPQQVAAFVARVGWNVLHGRLTGDEAGASLQLDWRSWRPGDIVLFHNPGGAYGYWTHAALYIGNGLVVDASDFMNGVRLYPVERYQRYAEVTVLRPNVPEEVRITAVRWCVRQVGKPYDPLSAPLEPGRMYCSKLVWDGYRMAGTELVPARAWLLPDDLAAGDVTQIWHQRQEGSGTATVG